MENVQSVTYLHFVRFGHFIKDRTMAMFNLEVAHRKKRENAKFYVTLTCTRVKKMEFT